ncbi:DUF998 domain-containing protein [Actinoplanes sp. NPDC024001]|uniref:DUF998 domain-containing protein n=1 Tax=Actinoplanes sp. NPDC024001 TaxID=3154598 RepID=UPI0033EC1C94
MNNMVIRVPLAVAAAAIVTADVVNPRYSPVSETVSRYVNGNAGWLITVAILGIGLASAVLAAMVRGPGRWALAVWAGGLLVAGLFPADPPGRWSRPSVSEMVHGTAAWVALAAFPVAAVLLTRAAALSHRRGVLIGLTAASVVATAALFVVLGDVMDGPSLTVAGTPVVGLVERVVLAVDMVWLGIAAVTLRAPARRPAVSA